MTVYATAADLDTWLGDSQPTPPDVDRQLRRASELVDDHIVTAVYVVDGLGAPTEEFVIDALRDAVCAQVEFWAANDEEDDVLGPTQGVSLGSMQEQYGAGTNRITPTYLAPRAARALRTANLLTSAVGS